MGHLRSRNAEVHRRARSSRLSRGAGVAIALGLASCSGEDLLVGYNGAITAAQAGAAAGGTSISAGGVNVSGLSISAGGANATGLPVAVGGVAGAGTSLGTEVTYCARGGPSIKLPNIGVCASDLARRVFSFAICSCTNLDATSTITTDSFGASSTTRADVGGSIGVNGHYWVDDDIDAHIGGSLWAAGWIEFGQHDVAGDLECGGHLEVSGESRVHQNVYAATRVIAPELTIDGTLYQSDGNTTDIGSAKGGVRYLSTVPIATPCDCASPLDIQSVASYFENDNDNATQSLSQIALASVEGTTEYSLPCGRYFFDSIGGTGAITLHLTGKTIIAVGGDVSNSGGLSLLLDPDAELDLFVDGNVALSGTVVLGNPNRPAAARVYVAGVVAMSNSVALYANWYIPNYPLYVSAPTELWGAIFAQSLDVSGGLVVHYDRSILDLASCNSTAQTCSSYRDCANPTPACREGKCDICQLDSDCSPPLYCSQGRCEIESIIL
jgi:hypothetical protein